MPTGEFTAQIGRNAFPLQKNKKIPEKENPCATDSNSLSCTSFMKKQMDQYPCALDVQNYCIDKNIKDVKDVKKVSIQEINDCLEKNKNKLSLKCKESRASRVINNNTCEDNCIKLKGDTQIECLAACQLSATK